MKTLFLRTILFVSITALCVGHEVVAAENNTVAFDNKEANLDKEKLLPIIQTKSKYFAVPFEIKQTGAGSPPTHVELLYSIDFGKNWTVFDKVPVEKGKFIFHAQTDGEHWFTFKTYNADGTVKHGQSPAPMLKVYIDSADSVISAKSAVKMPASYQAEQENIKSKVQPNRDLAKSTQTSKSSLAVQKSGINVDAISTTPQKPLVLSIKRPPVRKTESPDESDMIGLMESDAPQPPYANNADTEPPVNEKSTATQKKEIKSKQGSASASNKNTVSSLADIGDLPALVSDDVATTETKTNKQPRFFVKETVRQSLPANDSVEASGIISIDDFTDEPHTNNSFEDEENFPDFDPTAHVELHPRYGENRNQLPRIEFAETSNESDETTSKEVVDFTNDNEVKAEEAITNNNSSNDNNSNEEATALPELPQLVSDDNPYIRISKVSLLSDATGSRILIRWEHDNTTWTGSKDATVHVFRGESIKGPWQPIAADKVNNGEFSWKLSKEDEKPFFIMLSCAKSGVEPVTDVTLQAIKVPVSQ
ncbi:MAG: hypothetical protein ACRC2T_14235 [Thermoguttaceae bacterium]